MKVSQRRHCGRIAPDVSLPASGSRRYGRETGGGAMKHAYSTVCWVNNESDAAHHMQSRSGQRTVAPSSREDAVMIGDWRQARSGLEVVEREKHERAEVCRGCRHARRVPAHQRSHRELSSVLAACSIFLAPTSLSPCLVAQYDSIALCALRETVASLTSSPLPHPHPHSFQVPIFLACCSTRRGALEFTIRARFGSCGLLQPPKSKTTARRHGWTLPRPTVRLGGRHTTLHLAIADPSFPQ